MGTGMGMDGVPLPSSRRERTGCVNAQRLLPRARGGGGVWHNALVVGSVSLWRRLLASRPSNFCYDKQARARGGGGGF